MISSALMNMRRYQENGISTLSADAGRVKRLCDTAVTLVR
ncbi:hypothetical protein GCWU000246_01434 [Jonquetella anthropi E3_33 E1]|nr:hypothetical protein GCWU000246_01434 [Jonquetella anthropi E3_33 E1]